MRLSRTEIPCSAGDLSASGMLLFPRTTTAGPHSPFRVAFALPDTGQWVDLDARLVRADSRERHVGWGVQFLDVPAEIQRILRRYVYSSVSTSLALSRTPAEPAPGDAHLTPTPHRPNTCMCPGATRQSTVPHDEAETSGEIRRCQTASQRRIARLLGIEKNRGSGEPAGH